jgi:dTDP-4-dehydrorhamnose reductase
MKVSVIGANGQLGTDICTTFRRNGDDVIELNHDQLDISNQADVFNKLKEIRPDLVINTAAMHNVEACEDDPVHSFLVNGVGARNLALASRDSGFTLVHISTDYVFDGVKGTPYIESDYPGPLNVYGNTKLAGELFIRSIAEKYFIFRVSALYGENLCRAKGGLNFVTLMLKLAKERDEVRVVNNEFVSPTFTQDIANQILYTAKSEAYGLHHVTSQGSCSWYEFAGKIFELTGASVKLSIANPDEFPAKVPRPYYSILENKSLQDLKLDIMPHWEDGLKRYLELLGEI